MKTHTATEVARLFQTIIFFPLFVFLRIIFRFEVRGQKYFEILSSKKGAIFAANHLGPFDGIVTAVAIAMSFNKSKNGNCLPIRYLAYKDYFSWIQPSMPFVFPVSLFVAGWLKINACIPVKSRQKNEIGKVPIKEILAPAIDVLKNNGKVFIFPEGKMSNNGSAQKGKRGVACLHKETGAPIIPMHLHGTFKLFSLDNFIRNRKIIVSFGEPIVLDINSGNDLQCMSDIADHVMKRISKLAPHGTHKRGSYKKEFSVMNTQGHA